VVLCDPNREIVSFVRASGQGEAAWASERRFDPGARAIQWKKLFSSPAAEFLCPRGCVWTTL
jgi:hypothetical protein